MLRHAMPLTPTPDTNDHVADASPRLTWSEDGAPRSGRFGDVYFSADDGLAESRAVFLAGCGLPEAWAGRRRFTVAELGFGTGLNILALLDLWRRDGPTNARLHVFSIEGFPLNRDEAAKALAAWPELAEVSAALLAAWPSGTPGFHRIDLPGFDVVIDIAVGDVASALSQWSGKADAWFLDGFSPAVNPEMWSDAVMAGIAARSAPGARLATFTVAGVVRRGLSERGFQVDKRPGHGRKRERLEARLPVVEPSGETPRMPKVAVVGAGIAGAAVCRALVAGGAEVVMVEAETPGAGGSGFPAALVTPRLDAGDALIAGFHAQALERAGQLYRAVPGGVTAQGVLQLEQADRDPARFAKIAAQAIWAPGAMATLNAHEASERLGEAASAGGLFMAGAMTVAPSAILSDWLDGAAPVVGKVARLERPNDRWRLLDDAGACLAEADVVVLTAGWGVADLAQALPLRPVRGQADWAEGTAVAAVAWGGYVAPTPTGLLFGATHDRDQFDVAPRAADTDRNLATLASRLPTLAEAVGQGDIRSRAAVRATMPDRLPICGALPGQEGVFVLGGLGSRGFCVAPLLGEHLAAVITAAPSPLPRATVDRLSPTRF